PCYMPNLTCPEQHRRAALITPITFFFIGPAPADIYTLSLHDALPISTSDPPAAGPREDQLFRGGRGDSGTGPPRRRCRTAPERRDRKSTRLNSSHSQISYAVFCLKKKKHTDQSAPDPQL